MELPLYEIFIDDMDDELGLQCVSLVDYPAIEKNFIHFSKDRARLQFDSEKRIVKGPALIPDLKIYRYNEYVGEYEVFFSKSTIEQLVEKYSKENKLNLIDVMHDGEITSDKAVCLESFIVSEDTPYLDYPVGTWVLSYKIYDDELWESVKKNELRGFSVEIVADCVRKFKKEESFDDFVDSFFFSVDMADIIDIVVNHKSVMVTYDDEQKDPALGRRQFVFVACGLSKAGNEVVRGYEFYGDHRHIDHDWCMLRLDRIKSMRVMKEMSPWNLSDLFAFPDGVLLNPTGDKSMIAVYATAY